MDMDELLDRLIFYISLVNLFAVLARLALRYAPADERTRTSPPYLDMNGLLIKLRLDRVAFGRRFFVIDDSRFAL